jgi:hypothetical protein
VNFDLTTCYYTENAWFQDSTFETKLRETAFKPFLQNEVAAVQHGAAAAGQAADGAGEDAR